MTMLEDRSAPVPSPHSMPFREHGVGCSSANAGERMVPHRGTGRRQQRQRMANGAGTRLARDRPDSHTETGAASRSGTLQPSPPSAGSAPQPTKRRYAGGRLLQVGLVEDERTEFIVHAMPARSKSVRWCRCRVLSKRYSTTPMSLPASSRTTSPSRVTSARSRSTCFDALPWPQRARNDRSSTPSRRPVLRVCHGRGSGRSLRRRRRRRRGESRGVVGFAVQRRCCVK